VSNITLNRSTRFRAALKGEIPIWLEKNILTESTAEQLREQYELDKLATESASLLTSILFTLGGLLLGGGVISFVAANWDDIPKNGKVALLLATLLAFHVTGYWLKNNRGWPRLGHALIFGGCLVFGANIGLFAQIFHISGEWYGAFGIWALGSLVVAWAVRSWLIGALTLYTSYIWFSGFLEGGRHSCWFYPFAIAMALLPLAQSVKSRALYTMIFIQVIMALCVVAGVEGRSGRYVALAMASGGLLCWAVGETHIVFGVRKEFGNLTRGIGILALAIAAYILSFHDTWGTPYQEPQKYMWLIPVAASAITGAVLIVILLSGKSADSNRRFYLSSIVIVIALICLCIGLDRFGNSIVLPTISANLAAFALAFVTIWRGIAEERRVPFWFGSLLSMLIVVSRFFEYESSLLLKSAVFIACGIAVMMAGTFYERLLRQKEAMQ